MDAAFKLATQPGGCSTQNSSRIVLVSDFDGTLALHGRKTNLDLLGLLSDHAKTGHRVIITSRNFVGNFAKQYLELVALRYPEIDPSRFEFVQKSSLKYLGNDDGAPLIADYVFSDDDADYIPHTVHVSVDPQSGATSFPLQHIRSLSGLATPDPCSLAPAYTAPPSALRAG